MNGGVVNGQATPTKHSMLDKLKLFNKEKSDRSSKAQISKRTSSSSGFSSARSERSDSSLSLNDGQSPAAVPNKTGSLKKLENSSKSKSKLLSSSKSSSKDASNSKKVDKKDKSPARNEMQAATESKILPPKIQKSSNKESKLKMVAGPKKLEVRSESKTSLSSIPGSKIAAPTACVGLNTGIPKPMAAIKGTTKPPIYQQSMKQEQYEIKTDKSGDISNANISANQDAKLHIVAPLLVDAPANGQLLGQHHAHPYPAHVSPHHQPQQMQHQSPQLLNPNNISMSDSSHSKSTHSSSTGLHSNSSESSVIYRPSSESGSDILHIRNGTMSSPNKIIIPNRKIDRFAEPVVVKEMGMGRNGHNGDSNMPHPANAATKSTAMGASTNGLPAAGVNNVNNGNKFNTVPSKMMHMVNGIIYEEEKQMTIMPMRPLLRGYNSHVTLPTRGARGQHIVSEYCDDVGQGYCSDGDALKKMPVRFSDIENGYLSEGGGGGMHGKHLTSILRARSQLPTTIEER